MVHILGGNKPQRPGVDDEKRQALAQMTATVQKTILLQGQRDPAGTMEWSMMFQKAIHAVLSARDEHRAKFASDEERKAFDAQHEQDPMAAGIADFIAQYAVKVAASANPQRQDVNGIPLLTSDDAVRKEMEMMYALAMVHAFANIASDLIARHYMKRPTVQ